MVRLDLQVVIVHVGVINPRRACAAKVTVLGVSVTQHLTFYAIVRATNDTNLLSGG